VIVVDTSLKYALLHRRDAHHAEAVGWHGTTGRRTSS
jgi:predicted nucleic acid-binding protein